ncbi:MAG: TIGR03067 domain-containing protein [Armatimonadaceae bacterium]
MRYALAALLFTSLAVAAPVPKAVKAKAPSLDGRWECVELNANDSDATKANPWVWDIEGEKLTIHRRINGELRPNEMNMTTTLAWPDPAKPEEVDYHRNGNGTKSVFKGRFVIDGDKLTVCYATDGGDRPSELKADKRYHFVRFKRISDN